MVRADRRASKELKDLIVKMCGQPTRGSRFEWMQVPDREARERWHWNLTTIVTQGDAQVPWKYTCEFTIHKNGDVTVSVMDTDRAEALAKVVADK
jgi:hypothetical protein